MSERARATFIIRVSKCSDDTVNSKRHTCWLVASRLCSSALLLPAVYSQPADGLACPGARVSAGEHPDERHTYALLVPERSLALFLCACRATTRLASEDGVPGRLTALLRAHGNPWRSRPSPRGLARAPRRARIALEDLIGVRGVAASPTRGYIGRGNISRRVSYCWSHRRRRRAPCRPLYCCPC